MVSFRKSIVKKNTCNKKLQFFIVCNSNVGMVGNNGNGEGAQTLSLDDDCHTPDTIIHEFIHAFGFRHEQSRHDRDLYITVHEDRISGKLSNFEKAVLSDTFGVPYNGFSIMQYRSTFFGKTDAHGKKLDTMTTK